jgi:hypothetical protein
VYQYPIRVAAQMRTSMQTSLGAAAPAQPPTDRIRSPEPSGLTPDEIRRIVLEIIG